MDDSELRKTLVKLQQELEQIDGIDDIDDESRARLEHLLVDIRSVLGREGGSPAEHYRSLGEQLVDGVQRYEAIHPALTAAMQHALDILSRAGI